MYDKDENSRMALAVIRKHEGLWLTRSQICKELGWAKSPTAIAAIESLVDGGMVKRVESATKQGYQMFTYTAVS